MAKTPTLESTEATDRSLSQRISKAALGLALMTLGAKALGFVEKQLLAYYFGLDARVDAYFVAASIPLLVFVTVRELVEPSFLPLFVGNLGAGKERRGWQLFGAAAAAIALVMVGLTLVTIVFPDRIIAWTAPGFDQDTRSEAAGLLRIMQPACLFLGLSTLTYITLNGYRKFVFPAAGDLFLKAAPVVICIALVSQLGIGALAAGFLVGAFGRVATHAIGLGTKLRGIAWPDREARTDLRAAMLLMAPLLFGVAFSQISGLADNFFSSQIGEGGVAARSYARKIVDLPILLVPYTLSVVLFPYFADFAARKDLDNLRRILTQLCHGLALAFGVLTVPIVMMSDSIVSVLLERGAFDESATARTSLPLQLYAIGLVPFALEAVIVPFFYGLKNTRTPVVVGLLGVILNIALSALLIRPFGVGGVALALTVSKTFKVVALALAISSQYYRIPWRPLLGSALVLLFSCGVSFLTLTVLFTVGLSPRDATSWFGRCGFLALNSTVSAVLFFVSVLSLGRRERELLLATIRSLPRWVRKSPK